MVSLINTHSVSDFERDPEVVLKEIKSSHRPVTLTVDGKAEFVVQDAAEYQAMVEKIRAAEDLAAIRQGLEQSLRGEWRPAEDCFRELEAKHGL